jgi:hypothetical protein
MPGSRSPSPAPDRKTAGTEVLNRLHDHDSNCREQSYGRCSTPDSPLVTKRPERAIPASPGNLLGRGGVRRVGGAGQAGTPMPVPRRRSPGRVEVRANLAEDLRLPGDKASSTSTLHKACIARGGRLWMAPLALPQQTPASR